MISSQDAQNPQNAQKSDTQTHYERPQRRGKHKVFIGMAPGVGKTYRMLDEAHQMKADGIDVAIGLVETHGRKETAAKIEGLEVIPCQQIVRGGVTLPEMDTEAILQRRPQVVLIDELAHTNVFGSQREKRYQDVEVILAAGIDVLSTVNIQHLESLNDLVARITGVVVRERIPDPFLDEADELVVVDVTPETLEERLKEGKIYAPNKIQQSLENFFQRKNLVALRELALREVADNIEEDRYEEQNSLPRSAIAGHSSTNKFCNIHESVMVCISTYPNSIRLLRRGARIASYMNARLYILFVENPDRFLTKEESLHIETCERLCREFNGTFLRQSSHDVAKAIIDMADKYHITQIVIGESLKSRWEMFLKGSLTQNIVRSLKHIDLHIIGIDRDV
ncbi:sensor histidine kinase KdpD [Tumidithrix elongata RA019]|uniref:Sensor histidine kinase KdpD n=1 Tax=Tumidithrix elongata BACA0141 TaxID=2716417 RepID=A0AAW9Q3C4_9CYAN|nr:sensor histidine kinase KdpD [Tumidithrix elongata RA019]